jgi:hypothetical protein
VARMNKIKKPDYNKEHVNKNCNKELGFLLMIAEVSKDLLSF